MVSSLNSIFQRDLNRLISIIDAVPQEKCLWNKSEIITNSSGHLTLHICGNLRHFIGHVLGRTSYVRDRHNEFHSKPVSIKELVNLLQITEREITQTLTDLTSEDLRQSYPIKVLGHEMTTEFFLSHLLGHLNYHLGQISILLKLHLAS
ncbi:MAG: DinB family protein [Flavobacteriales bacterium]